MHYYDKDTKAFVIPGIHGAQIVPDMITIDTKVGEDKNGDDIIQSKDYMRGVKVINVPASWVELKAGDPRISPQPGKMLDVIDDEVVLIDIPAPTQAEIDAKAWNESKAQRAEEVRNLTVKITGGITFDADEIAQQRMTRAVLIATSDAETVKWKTADNQLIDVTAAQLKEALRLAALAQATIWENYG